jgi:hypothetical protein
MSLQNITTMLRRVALDRDTKLQVLAVLAANPDPKAAEDIETLLRSYEEMETTERAALMERLRAVDTAYQEKVKAIDDGVQRDARLLQDDIERNDEIEKIRKSLT